MRTDASVPPPVPSSQSEVVVRLMGGLGNQMFEYAAARALANRSGAGLALDTISGFAYDEQYKRQYRLGAFSLRARIAAPFESYQGRIGRVRRVLDRVVARARDWDKRRYIAEGAGYGVARLREFRVEGRVYLDGLWQDEGYFADQVRAIRDDFEFRDEVRSSQPGLARDIEGSDSVSVHVRRLFIPPGGASPIPVDDEVRIAGLTRLPYYRAAIESMASRLPRARYFVFSDHLQWAKDRLRFPGPVTYVEEARGRPSDVADLYLMSRCRHHIISASTYSWWGAWLCGHPEKSVIAPAEGWTSPGIIPARWSKL